MKKLVLILTAMFILPHVYGQTTTTTTTTTDASQSPDNTSSGGEFTRGYLGARFLMTASSLKVKSSDNSELSTSFVAGYGGGGVIGINFTKHIGAQVEVLYSSLAQLYTDKSNIDHRLNVRYINVPLLFVLNTDVSKNLNLNLCAGPQMGFNTGSSLTTESSNTSENVDTINAVLAVKKSDVGFAYGLGVDFMIGTNLKFSLGYRGVLGLVDISDNSENLTTDDYYVLDRAHVNTHSGYAGLSLCF